jgi:hypothetical protein
MGSKDSAKACGQLRTLQRRVRVWGMRIVQQLVYGADAATEPNKDPGI